MTILLLINSTQGVFFHLKHISIFLLSVISGILIGIGGTAYLSCENQVLGSLFFTMGLFSITIFGFNLYTGKVGYILDNKPSYLFEVAIVWFGNIIGTIIFALLLIQTRLSFLQVKAIEISDVKLNQSPLSAFILAVFCGIIIYIAVESSHILKDLGKYIALFLSVCVFAISGFEHCIANMFYFTLGNAWSWKMLIYLGIITIGNAIGGMVVPVFRKMAKVERNI